MKKLNLFLNAAFIMAASAIFAQSNTGTVTQTGLNNEGIVDQTGGSHNTGTIISVGNLNKDKSTMWGNWRSGTSALMLAKGVTQIGSWNTALI